MMVLTVRPPFSPHGCASLTLCSPSRLASPRPAPPLASPPLCAAPHHDSIHNVVLVVFQRTDGLGPRHVGLGHHQLDVPLLQTAVIHLTEKRREEVGGSGGGGVLVFV